MKDLRCPNRTGNTDKALTMAVFWGDRYSGELCFLSLTKTACVPSQASEASASVGAFSL
jgi:hypothetical protein